MAKHNPNLYCVVCEFARRPKGRKVCHKCRSRMYAEKYPQRRVFYDLRNSARKRGIRFKVSLPQFEAWCRTPEGLLYLSLRGRGADDMTLDRIIEDGPYTIVNMQVLTKSENSAKYHTHYKKKIQHHYDSLMQNLPF